LELSTTKFFALSAAIGLLGDARRRRVEIGDRPGIAECNAEVARLPVPA
jgi:hypothetical protein